MRFICSREQQGGTFGVRVRQSELSLMASNLEEKRLITGQMSGWAKKDIKILQKLRNQRFRVWISRLSPSYSALTMADVLQQE